jgi:hypothetical protein
MSLLVDPPFALGQTLGVSSNDDGKNWVGAVKHFPDVDPTTGKVRSNRVKTCVAVRNVSGAALLPKRVARFDIDTAGVAPFADVDGYSAVTNEERVGVVDEYLPAAGVADKDVFWLTVAGPTEVAVALSGADVAVGDRLSCITAVTAGATTAGRVTPSSVGAATTAAGNNSLGVIGRACSVGATTGSSVLALISTNH